MEGESVAVLLAKPLGAFMLSGAIILGCSTAVQSAPRADNSLENARSVITVDSVNARETYRIDGGARRGNNLFHSFQRFNVGAGERVYFTNPAGVNNIIGRVTGSSRSEILGTLGVLGNANLFLINPNGIIFGPNARLDIRGSFTATTADRVRFGSQGFFSSSDAASPALLTVNPSAFLFDHATHGSIVNYSKSAESNAAGLRLDDNRSLILLGGNISFIGGTVGVQHGQVEVGGISETGSVGLRVNSTNLRLNYPDDVARANVDLRGRAKIDVGGERSGTVHLYGRYVSLRGGSRIVSRNQGVERGGNLVISASEAVGLSSPIVVLSTVTEGSGNAGNITINTQRLTVQNAAQVDAGTEGAGQGGRLEVNASESVRLAGEVRDVPSSLFTSTTGTGNAGDIVINTRNLIIENGAQIATDAIKNTTSTNRMLPQGQGGNVLINALSIELLGGDITTNTSGSGNAGDITINTNRLLVQAGNIQTAAFENPAVGSAGTVNITAGHILLRDDGDIRTEVENNTGGGGNINLNAHSIVALDDSDILAFSRGGRGGNIDLNTPVFIGFRYTPAPAGTDPEILQGNGHVDINASGKLGNGTITLPQINLPQGLVELPSDVIDASTLITQTCPNEAATAKPNQSQFIVTGRGGLPPDIEDSMGSDAVQVDLVTPEAETISNHPVALPKSDATDRTIIEAQGWIIAANGDVVLTASAPDVTPTYSQHILICQPQ